MLRVSGRRGRLVTTVTVLALLSSSCGSEADEEPAPAFGGILEPDVSVPATPEVAGVDTSAGDGTAVVSWVTDSDGGSPICIAEVEVVGADGDDPTQAHSGACVVGAITAGDNYSCAAGAGGVKCWGGGSFGRLGTGNTSDVGDEPDEMGVALNAVDLGVDRDGNPFEATEVAAGRNHSCAVGAAGGVKCWGQGGLGRLGNGNGDTSDVGDESDEMGVALDVVDLGVNRDGNPFKARSVTAGDHHSCAMDAAGDVKCWGAGSAGQLGTGNTSAVGDEPDEMGVALDVVDLGVVEMGIDGSVQVAGLTPGEYTVRVRVANAAGFSDWSEPYEFSTLPEPPGAPTNLEASPAVGGVALSWTAPEDAEVTDYRVEYRQDGDDTWVVVDDGFSSATSAFVELDPGGWLFRVSATVLDEEIVEVVDLADSYGEPATVGPVGPVTVPDTPTVTEVDTAAGDGTAVVSWATGDDGGSPICTAEVEVATADGQEVSADSWPCDVDDSVVGLFGSVQVAGLTPGEYTVRVRVANAAGFSDWSEPFVVDVPPEVPGRVEGLAAVPLGRGILVTWSSPVDDGGSTVTGYRVVADCCDSPLEKFVGPDTALEAVFDDLVPGATYEVTVVAVNDVGPGEESKVQVSTYALPGAPTDLVAAPGDSRVVLSWVASAALGDVGTVGYAVQYRSEGCIDGEACWETLQDATGGSTATATGLVNGTAYTFRVRAQGSVAPSGSLVSGELLSSEWVSSGWVTPYTTPDAPTDVSGVAGAGEVAVSWTAPGVDGGNAITGYTVEYSADAGGSWSTFASGVAAQSVTVTGLVNGSGYVFRVSATNEAGTGPWSEVSASVTPYTVPDAPTDVSGVAGAGEVAVSWTAPGVDGGSAITGY